MKEKSLLILDMDGVIVDVTGSYREVVRRTVLCYLREVFGVLDLSDDSVSLGDVAAFKQSGGLNNDWELTYELIDIVLRGYFDGDNASLAERIRALSEVEDDRELLSKCRSVLGASDRRSLARLGETPLSRFYSAPRFSRRGRSPFLINHGDVKSGNLVKRIFQELYLGKKLFEETYEDTPLFYGGPGYITKETLIPEAEQLEGLGRRCVLSIATGRPYAEAVYAMERFGITRLFAAVVTEDDVVKEEGFRKPHPFMLQRCQERCGYGGDDTVFYLGDMPDDMVAGARAKVVPLGFVYDGLDITATEREAHRELLHENGACRVFGNYGEILRFIETA